jgi:hypothetical protein
MKIFITAVFLFINSCLGIAQTTPGWYKTFTGKIGNLNAVIHLIKSSKDYYGYVWFDQNQWPMPLYSGEPVSKSDSISISASSGPLTITLTGVLLGNNFSGKSILQKENSGSKSAGFQLQATADKTFTTFIFLYSMGSGKLLPKIKNESTCDYYSGVVWPEENNLLDASLKKEIREMLGMKTASDPKIWLENEKNKFIGTWLKENSKLSPKDASEMGLSLSVEEQSRIMVMYENEHIITLANYGYSFSGGAHGNYATSTINLEKQTGKKLLLSDVLNAEGVKALPMFLDRVARLQYGITNNKSLKENNFFVEKIEPSKEFYVTSASIGFIYPPYAIKSFAEGEINLSVPFTALKAYLQPAFKK